MEKIKELKDEVFIKFKKKKQKKFTKMKKDFLFQKQKLLITSLRYVCFRYRSTAKIIFHFKKLVFDFCFFFFSFFVNLSFTIIHSGLLKKIKRV